MADTSKLSSFSLSELPVDQSRPPTMIHRPYVPLSTSTPVHMPSDNQQTTEATQDESSFQQVIPNISQQSLYPSLAAMELLLTQPYLTQYPSLEESLMT